MTENGIEQDFSSNVIRLLHKTVTVVPTDPVSLLPTAPMFSNIQVNSESISKTLTFKPKWLLPDQEIQINVPQQIKNEEIVAVEPCELNNNPHWPQPELKTITKGMISFKNQTPVPIYLGKEVKRCKIYKTTAPSQTRLVCLALICMQLKCD